MAKSSFLVARGRSLCKQTHSCACACTHSHTHTHTYICTHMHDCSHDIDTPIFHPPGSRAKSSHTHVNALNLHFFFVIFFSAPKRARLHAASWRAHRRVLHTFVLDLSQVFARGQDEEHPGLTHGFLEGSFHQRLVRGRAPRHRGVYIGRVTAVSRASISVLCQVGGLQVSISSFSCNRFEQEKYCGPCTSFFESLHLRPLPGGWPAGYRYLHPLTISSTQCAYMTATGCGTAKPCVRNPGQALSGMMARDGPTDTTYAMSVHI